MRNPQLDAAGDLDAPADARGPARRDHRPHPRHRGALRLDRRARREEGAAAARPFGVQPVLRELDAHAHDVRDRGQAAVGRRHQPQHRRVVDQQGRDAARHRRQPGGDERRHVRRPSCAVGRPAPDRRARQPDGPRARPRRQRRRRAPRAPDAGAARPVHHPALQAGLPQPDGRHRRRRAALARRPLADPRADDAGHARSARDRPEDAAADGRAVARRAGSPRHARGAGRLRRRRDAAPAERADARSAAAVDGRVLQALRADGGEARAGEARRDRHASRPDEPRRRDRFGRRRRRAERHPAAGHLRHRGADGGAEHPGGN